MVIAFVKGIVDSVGAGYVDVDVHGIGYRTWLSDRDCQAIVPGADVVLYTHHHIREDDEFLYGFLDEADRTWFELLIGVSGIGPKVALQIVSAAQFDTFAATVANEDAMGLAKLPGIGKKTAERLILELKDKIRSGPYRVGQATSTAAGRQVAATTRSWSGVSPLAMDVIEALQALGYNERQAMEAVSSTPLDDQDMAIEEAIRRCLGYFDQSRRSRQTSK